jgi:hypothetical protein
MDKSCSGAFPVGGPILDALFRKQQVFSQFERVHQRVASDFQAIISGCLRGADGVSPAGILPNGWEYVTCASLRRLARFLLYGSYMNVLELMNPNVVTVGLKTPSV